MGADIRQDAVATEEVSTPLAVLPRFARPGPSKQVEGVLRRLVAAIPEKEYEDKDLVLRYCPQTRDRSVDAFPAWLVELLVRYRVRP